MPRLLPFLADALGVVCLFAAPAGLLFIAHGLGY